MLALLVAGCGMGPAGAAATGETAPAAAPVRWLTPSVRADQRAAGVPARSQPEPAAHMIERLVRAHLADPSLAACVDQAGGSPYLGRLTLEWHGDTLAFQVESLLGLFDQVTNCINRLTYSWLTATPSASLHGSWSFELLRAPGGDLAARTLWRTPARATLDPGVLERVTGRLGGPGDRDGARRIARMGLLLGIAVDRSGQVFVADAENRSLRRVDPVTGQVRTVLIAPDFVAVHDRLGSYRRPTFQEPVSLQFDPAGHLYVLDALYGDVSRVDGAGLTRAYLGADHTPGALDDPLAMVFGPDGALYVADSGRHRIVRIDLARHTLTTVAGQADHPGHRDGARALFDHPEGLAIDDRGEHLYVSEWSNNTVRDIDLASGRVRTLAGRAGHAGHRDGKGAAARFDEPCALVYRSGALFVAESAGDVVRRIDLTTREVTTLAGAYRTPGHADGVGAAARISHYSDSDTGELPFGLAAGPDGTLYLADSGNFSVRTIAPTTGRVATLSGLSGEPEEPAPRAIAYGPGGQLYTTMGEALYRIEPDGAAVLVAGDPRAMGHADGVGRRARFRGPLTLAAAHDGALLVFEVSGRIRRVDPASGAVTTLADVQSIPWSAAVAADGTIYVGMTGEIVAVRPDGSQRILALPAHLMAYHHAAGALAMPLWRVNGLAVRGDALYVLDDERSVERQAAVATRLRRIDLAGGTYRTLGTWWTPWRDHVAPTSGGMVLDGDRLWIVRAGAITRFDLATGIERAALLPVPHHRGVLLGAHPQLNVPRQPVLSPRGALTFIDEAAVLRLRAGSQR